MAFDTGGDEMEPPSHPEADDAGPDQGPGENINWIIVIVGIVFLIVIVLHLTGTVGPASH